MTTAWLLVTLVVGYLLMLLAIVILPDHYSPWVYVTSVLVLLGVLQWL